MTRDFGVVSHESKWLPLLGVLMMALFCVCNCAQAQTGLYVLEKTETNSDDKTRPILNLGGTIAVTENTFQRDENYVATGGGGRVVDFHLKWTFDSPPRELKPGQQLELKVSGTATSSDTSYAPASTASFFASDNEMWTGGNYASIGNLQTGWAGTATGATRYKIPAGPPPTGPLATDVPSWLKPVYANIFNIQLTVNNKVLTTYHYKWQGQAEEGLESVVRRVLRAFAKKKNPAVLPVALPPTPRQPRFITADCSGSSVPRFRSLDYFPAESKARLQLVSDACPSWADLFRTNIFGDMKTEEAEKLVPDVARILVASNQNPKELRDILLTFLYSEEPENAEVYRLMMGGMNKSIVFDNLSKTLSPNDKLLRYARGRDRTCRRQQQQDLEKFMNDGKFAAAFFFATVDLTLNLVDMPVVQGSGLLLSYVQIIQRVSDKDPTLKDTINIDTLKLARDAGLARPEMPAEISGPFSYTLVFTDAWRAQDEWKAKWLDDPNRNLSEATKSRLEAAKSEGAWLNELDNSREEFGRAYVFNRAVRGALDAIFAKNGWKYDPGLTLDQDYNVHVAARKEVIRRMDEARAQIPAVAYFGGWIEPDALMPK